MPQRMQIEIVNLTAKREPLSIENAAGDVATVYVYDMIGGWDGVQAKDFVVAFNAIQAPQIDLRINSPGGSVFDARAMATAVASHPSRVTAHIDGIAASAASWLALAADEVVMAEGAFVMIHNSQAVGMGDKRVMTDLAIVLDQLDQSFVNDYMAKTGKSQDEIAAWMDAETWFSATDAVGHGFADRIATTKKATNQWNLSVYQNAPVELKQPSDAPSASPEPVNEQAPVQETGAPAQVQRHFALLVERIAA